VNVGRHLSWTFSRLERASRWGASCWSASVLSCNRTWYKLQMLVGVEIYLKMPNDPERHVVVDVQME
jgi:hypothetical protein